MTFILPSFGAGSIAHAQGPISLPSISNTYSVDFDGTDDYIDVGNDSSLSISGALSITAWIYADSLSGFPMIISKRESVAGHAYQFYSTGNKLNYNNGTIVQSTGTISTGAWTHVGVTFDGSGGVSFYINGSSAGTATAASTNPTNTEAVTIAKAFNGNYFNGKIDELAIFNRAISASDITAIYNSGVPNDITSLSPVGWWRMGDNDGGTGTTITDQGSGGNNGTLTNGPTFSNNVPVAPLTNTYSVSFDGTNDYMGSLPISRLGGATWTTTTPITLSAWVKVNSFATDDAVFGIGRYNADGSFNGGTAGGNSGLHMLSNGFYLHQSGNQNNLTGTFSTGTWYHIAWTWDGTNAVVYVDGSSNKTFTDTSNGYNTRMTVFAGGGGRWNGYADCIVDEITFWDSALTSANITSLYNGGTPGDPTALSPLVWYRMGDGTEANSGTDIYDMSGNSSANAKLINGPTFATDTP